MKNTWVLVPILAMDARLKLLTWTQEHRFVMSFELGSVKGFLVFNVSDILTN